MVKLVAALAAVLLLAACSESAPGTAVPTSAAADRSGPVDAKVPVELRPVLSVDPPGSPTGPDALEGDDGVYRVAPSIGEFTRFEDVGVEETPTGGWAINLKLPPDSTMLFADWTSKHVGEQLAIVVDGKLLIAPMIQSAITGGAVQVSDPEFTEATARELARSITG
ncbi:SecDF P1 head subdomain-containing protein [Actinokineospora sp. HUAS TT18]|uniref:SecDF P1 head subdomain-containing protein n=1 Tax=Actinokineospora sp. HUAS TT18 TaxID=3447451 RepID=UPI003F51F393